MKKGDGGVRFKRENNSTLLCVAFRGHTNMHNTVPVKSDLGQKVHQMLFLLSVVSSSRDQEKVKSDSCSEKDRDTKDEEQKELLLFRIGSDLA